MTEIDELFASCAGSLRQVGAREAHILSHIMSWDDLHPSKEEAIYAHRRAMGNSARVVDQSFLNDASLGNISFDFVTEDLASTIRPHDLEQARSLLAQAYQHIDKLLSLSEHQKRRIEELNKTCKRQQEEILAARETCLEQPSQENVSTLEKQLKRLKEEKEQLLQNLDDVRLKAAKAEIAHQTAEREWKKQADL